MPKFVDHTGKRFDRLLVMERAPPRGTMKSMWRCRCDCGAVIDAFARNLVAGSTRSCGCLKDEASAARLRGRGHGMTGKRTHNAWRAAKERVSNPNNKKFGDYGGRGIRMCDRWLDSFDAFLADMGEAPSGGELERDDVNGHYEPKNCRWASRAEQMLNKRSTTTILYAERELSLREFSSLAQVPYQTVVSRVGALRLRGVRRADGAAILAADRSAYLSAAKRQAGSL